MTILRLIHTVQVLCIVFSSDCLVGAFQPTTCNGAWASVSGLSNCYPKSPNGRTRSTLLFSSIPARNTESTNESTLPTVNVVINNADALIHGPAHAAALERAGRESVSNGAPTNLTSTQSHPLAPTVSTSDGADSEQSIQANGNPGTDESPTSVPGQNIGPSPKAPPTTRRTQKTSGAARKSPVVIAESIQELLDLMDGSTETAEPWMTLVLFHAHYCKICQRASMQLTKAAKEYPSIRFAKVESKVIPEPAADNLRSIGVSKFPFIQIYRKGSCVASFSTGPTHMFLRKVRGTLDLCLERDEECWEEFTSEFATEIATNQEARNNLLPNASTGSTEQGGPPTELHP